MPIKLAFSTVGCPEWTLEEACKQAQAIGYAGVELRTLGPGSTVLASEPALSDPKKVSAIFRALGVAPVCLSTSISFHHSDPTTAKAAVFDARRAIDTAAAIGSPAIRLFAYEVEPGQDRRGVLELVANGAESIADYAGEKGVQVLFENAGSFTRAKEWWWFFSIVDHPMIGLCWNVANAAAAGESAAVSVPTLASRIRLAKVKDLVLGSGAGFTQLGDGNVGVEKFLHRLLGVGYEGFVTVEWDKAWLPTLAPASEFLPEAHKRLQGWLDKVTDAAAAAKGGKKGAKKPAEKPAAEKPATAH